LKVIFGSDHSVPPTVPLKNYQYAHVLKEQTGVYP